MGVGGKYRQVITAKCCKDQCGSMKSVHQNEGGNSAENAYYAVGCKSIKSIEKRDEDILKRFTVWFTN